MLSEEATNTNFIAFGLNRSMKYIHVGKCLSTERLLTRECRKLLAIQEIKLIIFIFHFCCLIIFFHYFLELDTLKKKYLYNLVAI
jgi:hypothetical protein